MKKLRKWGILRFSLIIPLFLLPFLIYLKRLSPTIYGGDSADFATASYFLGVAHPPGYPLFTLIGHLFGLLPFGSSYAAKVNLASAFFQAATVPFIFYIVYILTRKLTVSLFGAGLAAFSYTFWFYAELAEVFALNNFLGCLLILLVLLWRKTKKEFYFFALFLVFGLALANHHTIVLILPAFVFFIIATDKKVLTRPKNVLISLTLLFLGLLFYLYPFFAARANPPIVWDNPVTFQNLLRLIARGDYGAFQSSRVAFFEAPLGRLQYFLLYWRFVIVDFTVIGFLLSILGIVFTTIRDRVLGIFLILGTVFAGFLFLMYANFPLGGAFELGVIERFLMLSFIFLIISSSLAIYYLPDFLSRFLPLRKRVKTFLFNAIAVVFLVLPLLLFLINSEKIDLSKNTWGKTFAADILDTPEKDSLLLVSGDTVVFNTLYLNLVEKERTDLILVPQSFIFLDWYYPGKLRQLYPHVSTPQFSEINQELKQFIKDNAKNMPIYRFGPPPNVDGYVWIPYGLTYKLFPEDAQPKASEVEAMNKKLWQEYRVPSQAKGYKDLNFEVAQNLYSQAEMVLGDYYNYNKLMKASQDAYQEALIINPDSYDARINFASSLALEGKCQESLDQFNLLLKKDEQDFSVLESISGLYKTCFKDEKKAKEFEERARKTKEKVTQEPPLEKF